MRLEHKDIPEDLRDACAALDEVGAHEREAARADLEARIFAATVMSAPGTDVAAVASAMERLGKQERDAAAPGLEDRLYVLTAGRLSGAPGLAERAKFVRGWMRLAAAVAVAAGAGMLWWATRQPGTVAPVVEAEEQEVAALKSDLEALLAMDETDDFAAEFDVIYARAALLDDTLESEWVDEELFNVEEEM